MWGSKVKQLEGKLAAKDVRISELETVVNEVRRFISVQNLEHEGKGGEPHTTTNQLMRQLSLIMVGAARTGRTRQRSVARQYDGTHIGRRRNTDE